METINRITLFHIAEEKEQKFYNICEVFKNPVFER